MRVDRERLANIEPFRLKIVNLNEKTHICKSPKKNKTEKDEHIKESEIKILPVSQKMRAKQIFSTDRVRFGTPIENLSFHKRWNIHVVPHGYAFHVVHSWHGPCYSRSMRHVRPLSYFKITSLFFIFYKIQ